MHYSFEEIAAKFLLHCVAVDIRTLLTVSKEAAGNDCLRPVQPVDTSQQTLCSVHVEGLLVTLKTLHHECSFSPIFSDYIECEAHY